MNFHFNISVLFLRLFSAFMALAAKFASKTRFILPVHLQSRCLSATQGLFMACPEQQMLQQPGCSVAPNFVGLKTAPFQAYHATIPASVPHMRLNPFTQPPIQVTDKNVLGVVDYFNVNENYGYLMRLDTRERIYVNGNQFRNRDESDPSRSRLKPGQKVEFDVGSAPNGIRALRVKVVDDSPTDRYRKGLKIIGGYYSDSRYCTMDIKDNTETKVRGVVLSYSVHKRFGFIKRSDTGEQLFVHMYGIAVKNPQHVVRSLGVAEEVEFDVSANDKGPNATNVTGPDGTPVRGNIAVEGPFAFKLFNG